MGLHSISIDSALVLGAGVLLLAVKYSGVWARIKQAWQSKLNQLHEDWDEEAVPAPVKAVSEEDIDVSAAQRGSRY